MIYFDNPATTFPKPNCLSEEISKCIKFYCGNPGRSSHSLSIKSAEKIYDTRALLAKIFGASSENVIFTYNTTYALNIAIKSLLKPHSHVLISDIEHNAVLRPIISLSRQNLCSYSLFCTDGACEDILKSIEDSITSDTNMLICTHCSNVGERRLPIKEIGALCREKGITFIVDGAQSAGVHQINVHDMCIDALCIPAHKSLYGPQGLGMIIFNDDIIGKIIIEGGTGINSLESEMPDFLPERYEAGTMSTPLISGLYESLKWLTDIGIDNIRAYEEELYKTALDLLSINKRIIVYKMNSYPGNTLMFNIKGLPASIVSSELDKRGICTRGGFHCAPLAHQKLKTGPGGALRIGFSVFNTKKEIFSFYEAICEIIKEYKKPIIN
ncbi:MAG: aminotransferase class V-fold PLP-dependent enzyme [Clostridia bacterium]|nr:aminotransferase class V-fold PLP-dependent enzyme [Clostridia bacterium]